MFTPPISPALGLAHNWTTDKPTTDCGNRNLILWLKMNNTSHIANVVSEHEVKEAPNTLT